MGESKALLPLFFPVSVFPLRYFASSAVKRFQVYSGMMSYEKAARELPFLGFMFEMPIVVAGGGVSGS